MKKTKMQVSLVINSIVLHDSIISKIDSSNMIKLGLTQKPQIFKQEYIINNLQGLHDINHEFKLNNTPKVIKEVKLSIRKVEKKWCFENLFKFGFKRDNTKENCFTGRPNEKNNTNIQYEYEQLANSLLGICTINVESLEKGVNNQIRAEIMSKRDQKVIGYAHIGIYKWNDIDYTQVLCQSKDDIFSKKIHFEDPGCSVLEKK